MTNAKGATLNSRIVELAERFQKDVRNSCEGLDDGMILSAILLMDKDRPERDDLVEIAVYTHATAALSVVMRERELH